MQKLTKRWIKATCWIVLLNKEIAMANKSATTMKWVGGKLRFGDSTIKLVDELIQVGWKPTFEKGENSLERECRTEKSWIVSVERRTDECHLWLLQNLHPWKTASIMRMLDKMDETRSLKAARVVVSNKRFRVYYEQKQTVEVQVTS